MDYFEHLNVISATAAMAIGIRQSAQEDANEILKEDEGAAVPPLFGG